MNAAEDALAPSAESTREVAARDIPAQPAPRAGPSLGSWLLRRLLSALGDPPIEFVLWNGEHVATSPEASVRVHVRDSATLYGLFADALVRFGDAYSSGRIEIEGDLVRFLEDVYGASMKAGAKGDAYRRIALSLHRPRRNTRMSSLENIHHHYDIGNEFYELWLGRTMAYTCAYYPTRATTLDDAQVAKMNHVCRKLGLRPGQSVVEAGCGWGTLALHMARRFGVTVRAFNISGEQIAFARERARAAGLESRVEYVGDDYRNIRGQYDAFVSVGMLEHVGVEHYPELGRLAARCLPPHGRGLIHSIGRNRPGRLHPWIERRIFPGAQPPSIGEMMQIFEPAGLSVLDVENLRLHYARTLTHWRELFEANAERVQAMFDEQFVRMWRLYLAGSIAAFNIGSLQLFQVVFAPQGNNDVPWTRAHLYRD